MINYRIILVLTLLFLACSEKKQQLTEPKIRVVHNTIDLGSVQALTQVEKSVMVSNAGTGILEISSVQPSC